MRLRLDASDFKLAVSGKLSEWREAVRVAHMTAARGALEEVAAAGKAKLRADLRNAGLGGLEKSWQDEIHPRRGLAHSPAVEVYSKAPVIVSAFEEGPTITPTSDGMLAIPIPGSYAEDFPNPPGSDDKVDYARRRFGDRLFVIPANANRPAILAARMVGVSRGGRLGPRKKTKTGKFTKGTQTAMLFYLVPQVRLPKLLNIQRRFDEMRNSLPSVFAQRLAKELAAAGVS